MVIIRAWDIRQLQANSCCGGVEIDTFGSTRPFRTTDTNYRTRTVMTEGASVPKWETGGLPPCCGGRWVREVSFCVVRTATTTIIDSIDEIVPDSCPRKRLWQPEHG